MNDISHLEQIRIACTYLKTDHQISQKGLTEILTKRESFRSPRNSQIFISEQTLSSYLTATDYYRGVTEGKAIQIINAINRFIEQEYKYIFDSSEKKYIPISQINTLQYKHKLEALIGVWEAYSWDYSTTIEKDEGYVHAFRIWIRGTEDIISSTHETNFEKGRMYLVTPEKACMEISDESRKAFFIVNFGSATADFLKNKQSFTFIYADTGIFSLRTGVVVLRRTNNILYEDIVCTSKPVSHLNDHLSDLEKTLKGKQIVIP